jgi:integrase
MGSQTEPKALEGRSKMLYRRKTGQDKSQVWYMSFVYKGKRYRRSTETTDWKTAKKIHDSVRGRCAEEKWIGPLEESQRTFQELTDRYMAEHSKVKKKSWRRDENSLNHLLPFFGDCNLSDVTSETISRYKAMRLQEGAKPATLNRETAMAKHCFNLGLKEWGWCRENPFCKVKMEREDNSRDRVLTYDEEERLLAACSNRLRDIVLFALSTGARMGEILELTWKDVDLFRKVVVIRQGKTGKPKTIPLIPTAMDILKSRVRRIDTSLVFPSQNGTRMTDTNLGRAFRAALKKARVEGFRFHDLRHTFASRLAMAGKDLYVIQKLLGHREPRMVQRYAHHSVQSLRDGIEVLETLKREAGRDRGTNPSHLEGRSGSAANRA